MCSSWSILSNSVPRARRKKNIHCLLCVYNSSSYDSRNSFFFSSKSILSFARREMALTAAPGPAIIEYNHDLLGSSRKWAEKWSPGDEHVCWQDGHSFDWFPVPVPTGYDETRRTYTVFGKFCSWQCAKRWLMDNPSFNTPIARCWLATMAKEQFGYKHDVIHPAPKRWVLLTNSMTIDQYRQQCGANIPCETVHPPLLPACMASISGQTSKVLESIYTTRNNETIGGSTDAATRHRHLPPHQASSLSTKSI